MKSYKHNKRSFYCGLIIFFLSTLSAHDKWIVVTTIQQPTSQLKKLAQLPGWRLVVVGDKKTPNNWYLDNCDYLSPEKQLTLGYKLASLLPWNHYSRKNIGYLYAIENGAKIIYETDDDNEPLYDLQPMTNPVSLPLLTSEEPCINIYHYFGHTKVWPRGYPLEKISASAAYTIIPTFNKEIGIEQSIVNNDPDVDAIFRLTQPQEISFLSKTACLLPIGTYCPFNSQNTFIHKKAFFTLYLPSSVTSRVADIWRSYYAQKLMHLHNLYLSFSGPNAIQLRNDHNLMHDFILEQDLYLKSMDLINFLVVWQCDELINPLQTMKNLMGDLVFAQFLQEKELTLFQAWLEDLTALNYQC